MPKLTGLVRRGGNATQSAGINPAARPAALPSSPVPLPPSALPLRKAFTLTELLIVIAIIAVLASLVTAAAVRAMNRAKQAAITLELGQLGASIENFKNDYGAYPPNGMNSDPGSTVSGSIGRVVESDMVGMFKKMFPKHREDPRVILALCGQFTGGGDFDVSEFQNGLTAAEAVYFWLGGFSDDELYPISGPRGPSFLKNGDAGEVIEDRNRKYDFDLARLRPVDDSGDLDTGAVRYMEYPDPRDPDNTNLRRRIHFWRFHPSGSEQPIAYFDVSRHKPGPLTGPNYRSGRYDMLAAPNSDAPPVFALKQLRRGIKSANNSFSNITFVEQGKFQILHSGLDDAWGDEFNAMGCTDPTTGDPMKPNDVILYPAGPFVGETADTLANFYDGTLEDEAEE